MDAKNDEIIKKLIQWRIEELQLIIKDSSISNEEKKQIKHELDGLEKFGIDAIASSFSFFNAGNVVTLTIQAGTNTINRVARILMYTEPDIIFIEIDTNAIFRVLRYNIIMMELLEIVSDDFREYIEVDIDNWNKCHDKKGDNLYG